MKNDPTPLRFTAHVITGAGRGRQLGVPTLNLDLRDVPDTLDDGIFACWAIINGVEYPATMHHGARPTFGDTRSCEVHLLDEVLASPPEKTEVETVKFLRGIEKFASAEALTTQMREDIRRARDILMT